MAYVDTPLDFNAADFEDLIEFQGKAFLWFRGFSAPDYAPAHGVYTLASALTTEDGKVYVQQSAQDGEAFRALFEGLDKRQMGPDGMLVPVGEGQVTFSRAHTPLTHGDKLVVLYLEFSDEAKLKMADVLPRVPATELIAVRGASVEYIVGTDCELNSEGTAIDWLPDGEAPDDEEIVTVKYRYNPTYYFLENQFRPAMRNQEDELLLESGILTLRLNRADGA